MERIARGVFERVWNTGEYDLIPKLFAPHAVFHTPADRAPVHGPEGYRAFVERVRRGIPDIQFEIQDFFTEGKKAAIRCTTKGTHTGPYLGLPPTDRPISTTQNFIVWVENGQIVEAWQEINGQLLVEQLGVAPPQGVGPLQFLGWAFRTVFRIGLLQARYQRQQRGRPQS
jgi:steroid delta-isomerase-like uncharacterized protein